MAQMIDAQSIVVAGAATGLQGDEGEILRYGFWHLVALRPWAHGLTWAHNPGDWQQGRQSRRAW